MSNSPKEIVEEFEKDYWQPCAEALLDYAHSEGYENPMSYPPDEFKKITTFWISKLTDSYNQGRADVLKELEEKLPKIDYPIEEATDRYSEACVLGQEHILLRVKEFIEKMK